jgi:hypothetical protein
VLRLYSQFENSQGDLDFPQKIGVITSDSFNVTCSEYVNQLVQTGNYSGALLVCMTMTDSYPLLKRRLIFDTVGHICNAMWEEKSIETLKEMETFYTKALHLPPKFIQVFVALKNESNGHFVAAMEKWMEAQNYQKAHDVFM